MLTLLVMTRLGTHHVVQTDNEETTVGELMSMNAMCGTDSGNGHWIIAIAPRKTTTMCGECCAMLISAANRDSE